MPEEHLTEDNCRVDEEFLMDEKPPIPVDLEEEESRFHEYKFINLTDEAVPENKANRSEMSSPNVGPLNHRMDYWDPSQQRTRSECDPSGLNRSSFN